MLFVSFHFSIASANVNKKLRFNIRMKAKKQNIATFIKKKGSNEPFCN